MRDLYPPPPPCHPLSPSTEPKLIHADACHAIISATLCQPFKDKDKFRRFLQPYGHTQEPAPAFPEDLSP